MDYDYAVLAWAAGEGYLGIESFHPSYGQAEARSAYLYKTAKRVFRRAYPSRGDHYFIPIIVDNFRAGVNGNKYPDGIQYTPYWD